MKNIILIGMPGAGKSSAGVLAAKALGMGFVDTDIEIQRIHGKTLSELIASRGTQDFLKLEEEALYTLEAKNCVIATGGSAVFSQKGMEKLKESGTAVYMEVPLPELKKRLGNIATRGVVCEQGEGIDRLFAKREPLYLLHADITIKWRRRDTLESTVKKIIDAVNNG